MIEPGAIVPPGVSPAAFFTPAGGMNGTESNHAVTPCGEDIVRYAVLNVPEKSPSQRRNLYPPFAAAVSWTCVPSGKYPSGDGGTVVNEAAFAGFVAVSSK